MEIFGVSMSVLLVLEKFFKKWGWFLKICIIIVESLKVVDVEEGGELNDIDVDIVEIYE